MIKNIDILTRHALSVAIITPPALRQQLFTVLPSDTFKGPTQYFKLGRFFATDDVAENFEDVAKATRLDPVELVALMAEDESYRPLHEHLIKLLSARQTAAQADGQDVVPWANAIVKISEMSKSTNKGCKDLPTLKTGRDLRDMDIKVEWLVEGIIPRQSVVLLYGRGGIGKTTLMMMLSNAIDRGEAIFGLATVKAQVVVIDYENSLAVLSERAKRTDVDGVLFWDSGSNPPSLDKANWDAYSKLLEQYPRAVFVFDTLRSSHSGDECVFR